MKRVLLVILIVAALAAAPVLATFQNNSVSFTHNITPPMGTQTDYPVRFILSNASGVSGYYAPDNVIYTNGTTRPDWADINATDSSDAPLKFWPETGTNTATNITAWVNVPTLSSANTTGGKWLFGNSSQTVSTMDGLNTFTFWDDCDSLNTTQIMSLGATTSGGICILGTAALDSKNISTIATFPANTTFRSYYQFYHNANDKTTHGYFTATKYAKFDWNVINVGSYSYINKDSSGVSQTYTDSDVYKVREIKRNSIDNLIFSVAGVSDYTRTAQVPTGSMGVQFLMNTNPEVNPININWFLVRKSVATEPTTSLYSSTLPPGPSAPVASFTTNVTSGSVPFTVQFNDTSSDTPTSWVWMFGDGAWSSSQNTTHTYQAPGLYNAILLSKNAQGSNTTTAKIWASNTVSGYLYNQRFNVNATSARAWYPVALDVYAGTGTSSGSTLFLNNHASNFPYDIRFNTTGSTLEVPHWTETPLVNSTYARIWISPPTIDNTLVVSYGKVGGTDSASGYLAFPFFDDFTRPTYTPTATGYPIAINASRYEAWPGVTQLSSGTLVAIYRTSETNTHDYDSTGRVVIRNSTDNGVTWGDEIVVSDVANADDRNANIATVNISGVETLLATYNAYYSLGTPQWPKSRMSTDGGNTWSAEVNTSGTATVLGGYGRPIQLSNGKILTPWHYATGTYDIYIEETPNGVTWTDYVATGSASIKPVEASILETKTNGVYQGGVLILARTEASPYTIYKSTSTDYGHTWSAFTATTLPNPTQANPPDLYRLSNGNILAEYSISNAAVAYESIDEGITWSKYTDIATPVNVASYYDHAVSLNSTYVGSIYCTNLDSGSDVYFVHSPYPLSISSYWRQNGTANATIVSGELDYNQTSVNQYIRSGNSYGQTYSIMSMNRIKTISFATGAGMAEWGFGFRAYPTLVDFNGLVVSSYGATNPVFMQSSTSSASSATSTTTIDTLYKRHEMIRNGSTSSIWYINGTNAGTITTNLTSASLPATVGSSYIAVSSIEESVFDWIAIREYIFPEPTVSGWVGEGTSDGPPIAAFSCTPTTVSLGSSMACIDQSTNSTVTSWNWSFGDGNTSIEQNPTYTYPFVGTFNVSLFANNTAGGDWENKTAYITVQNQTGFTQQDLWQTGHYTITLNIKDSTNAPIPVVTVTDSNGQSYTTTNGTAFFTEDAGAVVFYFASTGYVSKAMSYIVDEDATHTVQLVTLDTNEPVYNVYPPKDVKFHITSFFGSPIPGASVTIQGITTSTGNWDWLVTLLGISLDEVAINGTAMTESTDSNGDAVFLMLPSVKYNITTTATGYTFPTSFIAPQATEYTIAANWNESWFSGGNDTLKEVNVSVSWVTINSTHSFVNITYDDKTTTTTGGDFRIYREAATRMANTTPIAVMNITSSSCSNSTIVNIPTGGAEYRVDVNASTTSGERVLRTFTHSFKGAPVNLPGWTPETQLWLALFILIFTAAFAGVLHAPQMSVILCVELWVFWSIGWMEYLINGNGYTEAALLIVFTLATFFTVIWSITEGKSKGKRSS
jgi:PKD repeat protein